MLIAGVGTRDQANHTNYYKHVAGLPLDVTAELKPVFSRLSEDIPDNQNEALNAMFWVRVQKSVFVDPEILQLGIYDAVAHCNIRCQASVKVLEELGISLRHYCKDEAQQADSVGVLKASCKE